MNVFRLSVVALAMFAFVVAGCDNKTADNKDGDKDDKKVEKEEHFHVHGPHAKGECFRFKGNEDFSAEVVTYDSDVVKIMFCSYDGKAKKKVKGTKMVATRTSGGDETFELTPLEADADGMIEGFMLESKDLKLAAKISIDVTATIDGKEYTGTAANAHHH